MHTITQSQLKELFSYDPLSGVVVHRTKKVKAQVGDRAGSSSKSESRYLRIAGKKQLEHRLIWLYVTGKLPEGEIDHIDHDRGNNAWRNLREVSHAQNMQNKPKYSSNSTGVTGVSIDNRCGKFRAYLSITGKPKGLGYFATLEDAVAARVASLSKKKGYHANHGN